MKMNLRPRCREWLPLSSQQLRLRNLVQIKGVNIEATFNDNNGKEILIYYTLHSCKDSEAFYKSEALPQRHLQQKWATIECKEMLKSNANCVCVKVWIHYNQHNNNTSNDNDQRNNDSYIVQGKQNEINETKEPINALTRKISNTCLSPYKLPRPPDHPTAADCTANRNEDKQENVVRDELLFSWGVYFSGLVALNHENTKHKANSLIFCLNGAEFASPNHLTNESLYEQIYSLSIPEVMMHEKKDEFLINSPSVSRSSTPSGFDSEENIVNMVKVRYTQLYASGGEVKRSYTLKKLLLLQEYQRRALQLSKESENLVDSVKRLCLHCITPKEFNKKTRTTSFTNYHQAHHHSMGRALSNLLAEYQEIDPKALYNGCQLMKEIETLKYRKEILEREFETMSERLDQKRQDLIDLIDVRFKLQIYLNKRSEVLNDEIAQMPGYYRDYMEKKEKKIQLTHQVEKKRVSLCMELSEIYPIGHNANAHTICGIPFPNLDAYFNNNKLANQIGAANVPPTAMNAAFGYLAHLVQMIAVIMNKPLRNHIVYDGSRTRIRNIIEYPLYTRSVLPSQPVRHGLYLLSQNIAQLSYDITGKWYKSTIENILNIFAKLSEVRKSHLEDQQQQHHSIITINMINEIHNHQHKHCKHNGSYLNSSSEFLRDSNSSVDMNHDSPSLSAVRQLNKLSPYLAMMPPNTSSPMPILNSNNGGPHQRICRSVGSYSDSEEEVSNILDQYYSNSDSNIPFQTDENF